MSANYKKQLFKNFILRKIRNFRAVKNPKKRRDKINRAFPNFSAFSEK